MPPARLRRLAGEWFPALDAAELDRICADAWAAVQSRGADHNALAVAAAAEVRRRGLGALGDQPSAPAAAPAEGDAPRRRREDATIAAGQVERRRPIVPARTTAQPAGDATVSPRRRTALDGPLFALPERPATRRAVLVLGALTAVLVAIIVIAAVGR